MSSLDTESEQAFHAACNRARSAVQLFEQATLPPQEREYWARAYHVLGLALVELCDGVAAEAAFAAAERIYRDLQRTDNLTDGVPPESFVYFVHSYYVRPESADITVATTDHGIDFPAIVHHGNIWATQFHPEKSQLVGERLLDNFGRL